MPNKRTVPALKVKQWLRTWDSVKFGADGHRRKPEPHFYMFSIPAIELRTLCGISRRSAEKVGSRVEDLGIQRQHDPDRSEEIERFVEYGFPWSTLSERKRRLPEYHDLRKPGWLPTAIVVNVLRKDDVRNGSSVEPSDLVQVREKDGTVTLELPYEEWKSDWLPKSHPPLEVIDGQHRLWAFDTSSRHSNFELPVVAFCGLDISWLAYLFYTINIKPKKINPSLAYDLYPLLRDQDWLDKAEDHPVYREARAQELTELLWKHEASPWYEKINMLGERGRRGASQSGWINALMGSLVKPWDARRGQVGGLFGSRLSGKGEVLNWNRTQQAAFLITAWTLFKEAVRTQNATWVKDLRVTAQADKNFLDQDDPAFYGQHSLIPTDQGIRGFLLILNEIFFKNAARLKLNEWQVRISEGSNTTLEVSAAIESMKKANFYVLLTKVAAALSSFDWRTSSAPNLTDDEKVRKLGYRGSSGYRALRDQLALHVSKMDIAEMRPSKDGK